MEQNKSKKKIILIVIGIILLIAAGIGMWFLYDHMKKDPVEGSKNVTISVVSERDNYSKNRSLTTDEQYLGDLLEKEGIIEFDKSDYGRFITAVDGYASSNDDQSWWGVLINGEMASTGVDEIVIEDGAKYTLELKIGW